MFGLSGDEQRIVAILTLGLVVGSGVKLVERLGGGAAAASSVDAGVVGSFKLKAQELELAASDSASVEAGFAIEVVAGAAARKAAPPQISNEASGLRIDLNTASREELQRLPKIGPVLAGRIVDHRSTYGPFAQIEDLTKVNGVGKRTLERLRPFLLPVK